LILDAGDDADGGVKGWKVLQQGQTTVDNGGGSNTVQKCTKVWDRTLGCGGSRSTYT